MLFDTNSLYNSGENLKKIRDKNSLYGAPRETPKTNYNGLKEFLQKIINYNNSLTAIKQKYMDILDKYNDSLNEEEKNALTEKINKIDDAIITREKLYKSEYGSILGKAVSLGGELSSGLLDMIPFGRAIRKKISGENYPLTELEQLPKSAGEKITRGLGQVAGFGTTLAGGELLGLGKAAGALGDVAGNVVAKAPVVSKVAPVIGSAVAEGAKFGAVDLANQLSDYISLMDKPDINVNELAKNSKFGFILDAINKGINAGALYTGIGNVPIKVISKIALKMLYDKIANGQTPTDDRDLVDKAFQYGMDALYFYGGSKAPAQTPENQGEDFDISVKKYEPVKTEPPKKEIKKLPYKEVEKLSYEEKKPISKGDIVFNKNETKPLKNYKTVIKEKELDNKAKKFIKNYDNNKLKLQELIKKIKDNKKVMNKNELTKLVRKVNDLNKKMIKNKPKYDLLKKNIFEEKTIYTGDEKPAPQIKYIDKVKKYGDDIETALPKNLTTKKEAIGKLKQLKNKIKKYNEYKEKVLDNKVLQTPEVMKKIEKTDMMIKKLELTKKGLYERKHNKYSANRRSVRFTSGLDIQRVIDDFKDKVKELKRKIKFRKLEKRDIEKGKLTKDLKPFMGDILEYFLNPSQMGKRNMKRLAEIYDTAELKYNVLSSKAERIVNILSSLEKDKNDSKLFVKLMKDLSLNYDKYEKKYGKNLDTIIDEAGRRLDLINNKNFNNTKLKILILQKNKNKLLDELIDVANKRGYRELGKTLTDIIERDRPYISFSRGKGGKKFYLTVKDKQTRKILFNSTYNNYQDLIRAKNRIESGKMQLGYYSVKKNGKVDSLFTKYNKERHIIKYDRITDKKIETNPLLQLANLLDTEISNIDLDEKEVYKNLLNKLKSNILKSTGKAFLTKRKYIANDPYNEFSDIFESTKRVMTKLPLISKKIMLSELKQVLKSARKNKNINEEEFKKMKIWVNSILSNKNETLITKKIIKPMIKLMALKYIGFKISTSFVNVLSAIPNTIEAIGMAKYSEKIPAKVYIPKTFDNFFKSFIMFTKFYRKYKGNLNVAEILNDWDKWSQNLKDLFTQKQLNIIKNGLNKNAFGTEFVDNFRKIIMGLENTETETLLDKVLDKSLIFMKITEPIARFTTYITLADLLGITNENLISEMSKKFTEASHGNYKIPTFLESKNEIAKIFLFLEKYSLNKLSIYTRGLHDNDKLLVSLAMQALIYGVAGIPFYDDIKGVLKWLSKYIGMHKLFIKTENVLQDRIIRDGLLGILGISAGRSSSINIPSVTGVMGNFISDVSGAVKDFGNLDYEQAFRKVMPTFINNIKKALTGKLISNNGKVIYKYTPTERMKKLLSFTSSKEADFFNKRNIKYMTLNYKQWVIKKIKAHLRNGNKKEAIKLAKNYLADLKDLYKNKLIDYNIYKSARITTKILRGKNNG